MQWYNQKAKIPIEAPEFIRIIDGFVFSCPSSIKRESKGDGGKKKVEYKPVSMRLCSFRSNGIESGLLVTILSQVRKFLNDPSSYAALKSNEKVIDKTASIITSTSLDDPYFDLMVYQSRNDMSDAEAIYYYIRNAFAHGSFEVIEAHGTRIYLLQSEKDGTVKAMMRLRESTLEELLELSKKTASELRQLQRLRNRQNSKR